MQAPQPDFGVLLKGYRDRAGLTQQELAAKAGLTRGAISDLECGATHPRPWTVGALAKALDLSPEEARTFAPAALRSAPIRSRRKSAAPAAEPSGPGVLPPRGAGWRLSARWILGIALVAILVVGSLLALTFRSRSPVPVDGRLHLETWQLSNQRQDTVVRSPEAIPARQHVTLIISGTYSPWPLAQWSAVCKGQPEPRPMYLSPGLAADANGPVGLDAEFMFAAPLGSSYCTYPDPPLSSLSPLEVSLNNGVTWRNPVALPDAYNPAHVYRYHLVGEAFPLQVRLNDVYYPDNYGVLLIQVVPDPVGSTPAPVSCSRSRGWRYVL